MNKKILSVTGTRADYGIYKPVYQALHAAPEFNLGLIVIGMHLLDAFGHTVDEIRNDPFTIAAEINTMSGEDTKEAMATFVGKSVIECAHVLEKEKPDILLLLGDRGEQLAAAIAAAELGIVIAHLHGGEHSGAVDDAMRHAITQMARIHLTSAEEHKKNVLQMKPHENPHNVHVVGAPALDAIRDTQRTPKETLCTEIGIDASMPIILFVQHPDTLAALSPTDQLTPTLEALREVKGSIVIFGSNADAGGSAMNNVLQQFAAESKQRSFIMNVPHSTFLSWQAAADVLVGNSSSGIIEAASFHLPVVNIGERQKGRLRSGNVLDVGYDAIEIGNAIEHAMSETFQSQIAQCHNVYGDGQAAQRIANILAGIPLSNEESAT